MTIKHFYSKIHFLGFFKSFKSLKTFCFFGLIFLVGYAPKHLSAQLKTADSSGGKNLTDARNVITKFFKSQSEVNYIYQVAISPDAASIVSCIEGPDGSKAIYKSSSSNTDSAIRITGSINKKWCNETDPRWSPDGSEIAFLSDAKSKGQLQVFVVNVATGRVTESPKPLTQLDGYVSHLQWSPDGKYLSVLYVEKASREPSPMAALNRAVGLIDSSLNTNVQRLAIVNRKTGKTQVVSPQGFYIFEYDWSPDSRKFVYSGALPPGDDNWYIAKLYKQSVSSNDTVLVYQPSRQVALPRWSPDGKNIAFIEGLMSDQGGTGGDIFIVSSDGGNARNLTPDRKSSPSWFTWRPDGNILFTEFVGGSVAANTLNISNGATQQLWKADQSIHAAAEVTSLSVAGVKNEPVIAFAASSWNKLPEIYFGNFNNLKQISHLNSKIKEPMPKAENVEWTNEGLHVQGWLLYPSNYDSSKHYPMLVSVHGGPAWLTTPTWSMPDFNTTVYTKLGYFVFFPNPRGSHGQGEAFTLANRRDWGYGDLRDIITGVDAVINKFPVDSQKVGLLGWSYGGSTTMFAVTQTKRFRAAVAGASAADWLSYYGQNAIDKWMFPYFGASPYDDPDAYAKCSAMTFIKNVKTPTLVLVGERDGEAPPPQSFQFWHALKELNVPTQLMIYPDEGHSFYKSEDRIDVSVRTLDWFNKYMSSENHQK